ncbi:hypothetical protein JVU11DRAFT_8152 [Chiua virens]|nr:hypothetical protein JVU11DRAFT_8152 [Chiua virens]
MRHYLTIICSVLEPHTHPIRGWEEEPYDSKPANQPYNPYLPPLAMMDLPIELVSAVVRKISSISDLLSLRSVNSAFRDLVTPQAFSELHIRNSVESAQTCLSILASPSLATHVREVVYDRRDHAQFSLLPPGAEDICNELEIADLEDALAETFCSLPGFKNLESVVLNFWPSFRSQRGTEIQEHPFWFSNRQIAVLHALHVAFKSSSIRSLTLNHVMLISPACYDFVSAVASSPLHHLSMSIVANSELSIWSGSKALNGPLSSLLPPSNSNFKSLVLRSPQGLYHSLNTQLRSFNYPALETLILENIVFDPVPSVDGIEDFIVRHKASLRRLEIRSCSSYVSSITTPIRSWSTIWRRLAEELGSLRVFVANDARQGYALLDDTHGYIPHPSFLAASPELTQEDEQAYLQFSGPR